MPAITIDDLATKIETGFGGLTNVKSGFGDVVDDVNALFECLDEGKGLEKFVGILGRMFDKLLVAFAKALNADTMASALKECAAVLSDLWKKILEILKKRFESLDAFPRALKWGPIAAFKSAEELLHLLTTANPSFNVNSRIDIVVASVGKLLDGMGGADGSVPIVGALSNQLKPLLEAAISGGDTAENLRGILLKLLVPDEKAIVNLLQSASSGKWWAWADLPTGVRPGGVHRWINDHDSYVDTAGRPLSNSQKAWARRFRTSLVMAIDGYLRSRGDSRTAMANSDSRLSYQSLTDVTTIVIDHIVSCVFEPEDFPRSENGLDGFEDVGLGFAASFARQIRVAIRGLLGTLFRGVWEFSIHSDALCEILSTVVGTVLSAILDGVIRNLTWTLRLVSRYAGDPHGGAAGAGYVVGGFDQTSPPRGISPQAVEYVVFIRANGLIVPMPVIPEYLLGVLRDLAAYIDAAYLHFHRSIPPADPPADPPAESDKPLATPSIPGLSSQHFFHSRVFPAIATDTVIAAEAQLVGKVLRLKAESSSRLTDTADLPRPVLRAYFGNNMVVMSPGENLADPYVAEHTFERAPKRNFRVTFLSSRGGMRNATCSVP